MADAITPITANPDTNNPTAFAVQSDLAWSQLKTAIPQMNGAIAAFNLNDVKDVSTTSQAIGAGSKTFTVSANKSFQPGQTLTFADAALPSTNLMQAIVNSYSGTSLSVTVLQTRGSGTIANWVISLAPMPMLEYDSSVLKVITGNGHESTNTKIRRFTTVSTNTAATDLTYADSATLGGTVTVLTAGWYFIRYSEVTTTSGQAGVSINSNQLTTNFNSITNAHRLVYTSVIPGDTSRYHGECAALLAVGDVLRVHTNSTAITDANTDTVFSVQKISLSGVSTGGGGGGGGGAPTDAQYIVAVADATLTNERVATSSTSIVVDTGTSGQIGFQRAAISGDVSIDANSNTAVIPDSTITNAKTATMAANTIKSNPTSGVINPTDMTVAINTIVGRGPTGNIDDLAVQAGLTITNTTIGRPAFTGDVTAAANSNALVIAPGAVVTSHLALNAVGNARAAKMPAGTIKCNNTLVSADPVDLAIPVSSLLVSDNAGTLKAMTLGDKITITSDVFNVTAPSEAEVLLAGNFVRYDVDGDPINVAGAKLNTVPEYTWATKPAAASNTDKWIYITGIGVEKHLWKSNGTRWIPQGRQVEIFRGQYGSLASPTLSLSATGKYNIGTDPVFPASFFSVGDELEIHAVVHKVGTSAACTFRIHLGTSATPTSNSLVYGISPAATDPHDVYGNPVIKIVNSTTYTTTSRLARGGTGLASGMEDQTTAFNTASAMTLTANLTAIVASNSIALMDFRVIYRC